MHGPWLVSCAVAAMALSVEAHAPAQPFRRSAAPTACVAKRPAPPDAVLEGKIASANGGIEAGRPGAWAALADLAQYACEVTGDRLPVDAAFRRCIRDCSDRRDRYFTHVFYALVLERFGDMLGAESQFLRALQSRDDPQAAYTAYMGYAALLDRQRRTRDALDVLNRFAGDWSYRSPPLQLKLALMRELGLDTRAEEAAAQRRSDADLARTRADMPPLSAIPVEANPLAQLAFGRTIEVVANAWIEPAAEAGAGGPGRLLYRRASMPDPRTFARTVAFVSGQRFVVVAELGTAGCRIAVGDARYDVEECPWRSGRVDATLFRVVDERTPLEPPFHVRLRSPVTGEPISLPPSESPPPP